MEEKKDRSIYVYDIETIASCFTYTAINIDTGEIKKYIIHEELNQISELIGHLLGSSIDKGVKGHIGFNNLNFDYPVIDYIIKWYNKAIKNAKIDFLYDESNKEVIKLIYKEAQRIIEIQNNNTSTSYQTATIKNEIIPQLDLFRIWHYNNKARMTSLKSLEISMNYPNVMDMPIDHTNENITIDQIEDILEYNLNDVLATYEFYKKSLSKIELRKSLIKQFNIPCLNWSDSKIGEELILKLYCDKTNKNHYEVKRQRTNRDKINIKDIILPYIKFESKEFNKILDYFDNKVITETKGSIEESVVYQGAKYFYGTGGIHQCIESGIYEADNDYMIIDADVASLYPSLSITNNFYIEHLGEDFVKVYQEIINLRLAAKKEGNSVLSDGFKLAANSVYGKSNDVNSFLYDPQFTMAITVNGQLLLTMLIERLTSKLNDITILQTNTDGVSIRIHRSNIAKYYNECNRWQEQTKLKLEFVEYSKMVIGDVNNYLAVTIDNKIKNKGRFEIDKVVGSEPAYHKDNSFKIIPLALQEFFVNNIPIKDTITNHKYIYDFCGRQKFKGNDYGEVHSINYDQYDLPSINKEKQQKNLRYYITNDGKTLIKQYSKGSSEFIHKGYNICVFNKYEDKADYDIDYSFYIKEAQKEIDNIISNQLTLF